MLITVSPSIYFLDHLLTGSELEEESSIIHFETRLDLFKIIYF